MVTAKKRHATVGELLDDLAQGSLTVGYQTAIMDVMRRVEAAMEEQSISRKELADRLGVHPSRVTRLLGNPDNITLRTLWRICTALGLEPTLSVNG